MLDSLIYSLNAVAPLIITVALGYFIKRTGLLSEAFWNGADKLVFNVALPTYLFIECSSSDFSVLFDLKYILFCLAGILTVFAGGCLIVPSIIKDKAKRGAFIQGIYRSNFAILGIPIAGALFGEDGVKLAAMMLVFAIPAYNVLAIIILSINRPGDGSGKAPSAGKIALGILKNPLIWGIILAVPFALTSATLPAFLDKSVTYVGNISTPLALLCLGAGFRFEDLKGRAGIALIAAGIKVMLIPTIACTIGVLLGFRGQQLGLIFILFGAPTAVSSFIMAKNMDSDYKLAGQIVLATTILSGFTIFVGSFVLRLLSLI
ncbi:MAG: AEC family transporter [Eubacteriales bacterium]